MTDYQQGKVDQANYVIQWLFQNHKHLELGDREFAYVHSTHLDRVMREFIKQEGGAVDEWWKK